VASYRAFEPVWSRPAVPCCGSAVSSHLTRVGSHCVCGYMWVCRWQCVDGDPPQRHQAQHHVGDAEAVSPWPSSDALSISPLGSLCSPASCLIPPALASVWLQRHVSFHLYWRLCGSKASHPAHSPRGHRPPDDRRHALPAPVLGDLRPR
jgi:hypothetical protein